MKSAVLIRQFSFALATMFFTVTTGFGADKSSAATKPNVLFIVADDLNDWTGFLAGHPQVKTPNLDRLAARGTFFRNAHVQSPLCNSSRISVLTGLRPSTTGIYGLKPSHREAPVTRDVVTLPQYFSRHGYTTAAFGKVFHEHPMKAKDRTNDFNISGPTIWPLLPKKKFVQTPDPEPWMDWGAFPAQDHDQADWKIASAAITQIKKQDRSKPLFLAVGFRLPHVPCYVSQKWFDMFPPVEEIRLPAYLENDRADVPEFAWRLHWKLPEPRTDWLKEKAQWKPLVRSYLASIAFMDSQVGRVLDALDAANQSTNTIIVFWSDNGWHLGEKDITGKCSLWERSTRVPLVFAGPDIPAGGDCAQPVETLDIFPTLNALCGLPARSELEGHSLIAQLKDPSRQRDWPAITTHNENNHAVRTDRWRFIRYADGSRELYDMTVDPNEWTNLVGRAEAQAVLSDLAAWLPKTNLPSIVFDAPRVLSQSNGVWHWEGIAMERN